MASSATPPPPIHLPPRFLRCLPAAAPGLSRRVGPPVSSRSYSVSSSSKAGSALRLPAADRVDQLRSPAPQVCGHQTLIVDRSCVSIGEARADDELRAAVRLRVRSFYEFNPSYNIEGHKDYVVEREFEALQERIAGKRTGFRRVSCINATLPLSQSLRSADDLCTTCKFSDEGERVVVGTLDLNQCLWLADELTGKRPEGTGDGIARAYLSNVCVAKELHRNGLGRALVLRSKEVAAGWGITDLYVHVAVDNEAAKKLYEKTGFVYENEEPAWQARFLGRPRRYLLWADLRSE